MKVPATHITHINLNIVKSMSDTVLLAHGSGGIKTQQLIQDYFFKLFDNPILNEATDSAVLDRPKGKICLTTDNFVVQPQDFPGGDIGKLAVCGTINDLAVSGAKPQYLSVGFILEEGLLLSDLMRYVKSMANTAKSAGVRIVTGDTKVVQRNNCDHLYINTTGIGTIQSEQEHISSGRKIKSGDAILINGYIGDHGMAIFSTRFPKQVSTKLLSDCNCLNELIGDLLAKKCKINFMRDPTRGGVAGVLNELSTQLNLGINILEDQLPVRPEVSGLCEILGFDPLYLANEGKVLLICPKEESEKILNIWRKHPLGKNARQIGHISNEHKGLVVMQTCYGGKRLIDPMISDPLPRIC
jgi:hydrogenase expression/formation protein HypE